MVWPFYCPKSTETLNLLQTNFKAASGSVETLTDLPTGLASLPSLAACSGDLEAGDCGIWEVGREGVLTLTPTNVVRC